MSFKVVQRDAAESGQPLHRSQPPVTGYATYVVIGTGPVGVRCAQRLLEHDDDAQVVVFGAETHPPYNRVKLSRYLAGHFPSSELDNPVDTAPNPRLAEFIDRRVVSIDRRNKTVTDAAGNIQPYSKLVLATGSNPHIPPIPGTDLDRVIPFRSLRDTQQLIELRRQARRICVIGAGALGLEAAAALKTRDNRVDLQVRAHLLGGLLRGEAEEFLEASLRELGVELRVGEIQALTGEDAVRSVNFADGQSLDVDAVVLCTGIKPEISLARKCGLKINRGIVVNEWLQTSDPDIYAVGECAEFSDKLYQFVRPGYEQVESCCVHLCRDRKTIAAASPYRGSLSDIQLKIANIPCALIGDLDAGGSRTFVYRDDKRRLYRRVHTSIGRITGAVHIGSWGEVNRLRQAVAGDETLDAEALARFEQGGRLWRNHFDDGIKQQPDHYLVCQCNCVTKGEICSAISAGKRSLPELQLATNAGSVCGSCRPLLAELLDAPVPNLVMRHARGIFVTSIVALLLIALAVFMPPAPISETVQTHWYWQTLWYDNFWKQVTGYSLLTLCLIATFLSLRKRWRRMTYGHVDHWRYLHSLVGVAALVLLVVHTGFRLGENLNLALTLVFLAATTTGSLVGVFMARNHHWTDLKLREHRKWWSRVHYALLWALPALIGYHILSVYYF